MGIIAHGANFGYVLLHSVDGGSTGNNLYVNIQFGIMRLDDWTTYYFLIFSL